MCFFHKWKKTSVRRYTRVCTKCGQIEELTGGGYGNSGSWQIIGTDRFFELVKNAHKLLHKILKCKFCPHCGEKIGEN